MSTRENIRLIARAPLKRCHFKTSFKLLMAFGSGEHNRLKNEGRGHYGEHLCEIIQVWMRCRLKRLVTRYKTCTVVSVVASCTLTIIYTFCDGYRFS